MLTEAQEQDRIGRGGAGDRAGHFIDRWQGTVGPGADPRDCVARVKAVLAAVLSLPDSLRAHEDALRNVLPKEFRITDETGSAMELADWGFHFVSDGRSWWFWDAGVTSEGAMWIEVAVEGSPYGTWALRALAAASGCQNLEQEG